ncbi:hypothetical protein HPB47_006012 [Ixodes persulcatus]|uniref:Uncharacterized protein n=1 Tax=Ixodes persulcatus TaxID=34615 RepID=A0AC60PC77_IXOPE|nr:hypothetical protein HPB47_006012 [Ixodes persulcatus]
MHSSRSAKEKGGLFKDPGPSLRVGGEEERQATEVLSPSAPTWSCQGPRQRQHADRGVGHCTFRRKDAHALQKRLNARARTTTVGWRRCRRRGPRGVPASCHGATIGHVLLRVRDGRAGSNPLAKLADGGGESLNWAATYRGDILAAPANNFLRASPEPSHSARFLVAFPAVADLARPCLPAGRRLANRLTRPAAGQGLLLSHSHLRWPHSDTFASGGGITLCARSERLNLSPSNEPMFLLECSIFSRF